MKAFLSHSSRNKAVVEQVAEDLGLANAELDSATFEQGVLNTKAIESALFRSSIFVLFLSKDAISSSMVKLEVSLAKELVGKGLIDKFLVVSLDDDAFQATPSEWKDYNIVRKVSSVQAISRLIQNVLMIANLRNAKFATPFVGRMKELNEAKERLIDPTAPQPKGLFVSGNAGIGRRTFARKLFADVYPSVNPLFPEIYVEPLDGYEEIFRKVYQVVSPIATLSAYRTRILAFSIAKSDEKANQIAQLIDTLVASREALVIHDHGGLLEDNGKIQPHVQEIINRIKSKLHPTTIFVGDRTVPRRNRAGSEALVYAPLASLERQDIRQLAAFLLREAEISYSEEQLQQIIELSDGHPFNVAFIVQTAKQYTLNIFLANPSELTQWKRNRSSAFLQKIKFTELEHAILLTLKTFSSLDFDTLAQTTDGSLPEIGAAMMRLMDLHIVEAKSDAYLIAPPLRIAVERDARFRGTDEKLGSIVRKVGALLNVNNEDSEISLSLINAGILAQLQENEKVTELFTAFLLPSHSVWLARRHYDATDYNESIRFAETALRGSDRLSPAGVVEACRCLCLAGTRLGREDAYEKGISILRRNSNDRWASSNLNFLMGFHARFQGKLPDAEASFRKAYEDSPRNFSAARELAAIRMVRGDMTEAEQFARQAFDKAADNRYVLDIMLSILIRRGVVENQLEIETLFDRLKVVGDEEGHSFYTTRRAEYAMQGGQLGEASKLIDEAKLKTPNNFGVRALRFEIYLDMGNKAVANEELKALETMVQRNSTGERQSNQRSLLEMKSRYLLSIGSFDDAKKLYRTAGVFTPDEMEKAIKEIEVEQAFRRR
jgi:tetratricopeptide (TPR) repeat protein